MTVGYVSQHAEELAGHGTVLDAVQRATGLTPGKARALLGRFLFSGEEAEKPVAGLSGGELRRLSLALLVNSGANMLVLDEPTNHLDVESREALEDALPASPARCCWCPTTARCSTRWAPAPWRSRTGGCAAYEGGWAEYVEAREARLASENGDAAPRRAEATRRRRLARTRARSGPSKNAQRAQRRLEREIEAAEAALRALEDELADPGAWADPDRAAASSARHADARRRGRGALRALGGGRRLRLLVGAGARDQHLGAAAAQRPPHQPRRDHAQRRQQP